MPRTHPLLRQERIAFLQDWRDSLERATTQNPTIAENSFRLEIVAEALQREETAQTAEESHAG